jgi:hypothetical protein
MLGTTTFVNKQNPLGDDTMVEYPATLAHFTFFPAMDARF